MARVSVPAGHNITPTEWALLLSFNQPVFARKTINESVTSSTVMQDDDALTVTVEASAEYWMQLFMIYSAGTAERIKYQWSAPASATMDWNIGAADSSVLAAKGIGWFGLSTMATVDSIGAAGTGTQMVAACFGLLRVSATSGTLKLQWAQNTSGVNATTIYAGSFLSLHRVN